MERYIQKILVPIDGSDSSKKALEMAAAFAQKVKGELTILEVIEDFGPLPGYYEAVPEGVSRLKWISEQRFEKVHPMLENSSIKWKRIVEEGYAADKICEIAESGNFDLIIIGNRGLSAVARFLVGSVSDRVIHHAPCSVMVVK
ncbi:MAG: universal stress protein [Leptospiraceae bacterium]|nr:universal stress protein [Leptospiraceae bacterium]MCP5496113.1 universal stress protein [Leptospiraceae bacterium]